MEAAEVPTYRRSNAFPVVREECLAVRNHVGIMEISGFGKYEVSGPGADAATGGTEAGGGAGSGAMMPKVMFDGA